MKRPSPLLSLGSLLLVCHLLPAQSPDVAALIGKAEEAVKRGKKEEATVMLRQAQRQLVGVESESVRANLRASIAEMLKKADGNQVQRSRAEGEAAKGLKGIAEAYAGAEWYRTAIELLEIAALLEPEAVVTELADVRRLLAEVSKAKRGKAPKALPTGVPELIARAEVALASGDKEEAAAALRLARRDAGQLAGDTTRASMANLVADLIKKADDLDGVRRQAENAAARLLIGAADLYTRAKWGQLALELLVTADALDPDLARKPLDEAKKRAGVAVGLGTPDARPGAGWRDQLLDWFKGGTEPFERKGWKVGPEGATSPTIEEHSTMLLSRQTVTGDARIGVEFLLGLVDGKLGLAFGAQGPDDFYVLEVRHEGAETEVVLVHVHGVDTAIVWSDWTVFSKETRADWMRISLEIRGGEVGIAVGTRTFRTRRTASARLDGMIGLFVSGNSENKKPVRFRGLTVEKL